MHLFIQLGDTSITLLSKAITLIIRECPLLVHSMHESPTRTQNCAVHLMLRNTYTQKGKREMQSVCKYCRLEAPRSTFRAQNRPDSTPHKDLHSGWIVTHFISLLLGLVEVLISFPRSREGSNYSGGKNKDTWGQPSQGSLKRHCSFSTLCSQATATQLIDL